MNQNWEEFMASLYHVPWRKKTKITKTKTKTKKHGINITIIILHATYARMSVNVSTVTYISFNQSKPIVESHAFRPTTDKTVPGVQIVECGTKSERWGEGGNKGGERKNETGGGSLALTPYSSLFAVLASYIFLYRPFHLNAWNRLPSNKQLLHLNISLRGRRLKGKGKGVLGARETREARKEGGCVTLPARERGVFYLEGWLATVVIYSDLFTSFSRVSYASPLRLKGNGPELNLGQPQLARRFFSSCVPPFLIAERGTEAFEVRLCGWRKTGRVYKVTQQHIPYY